MRNTGYKIRRTDYYRTELGISEICRSRVLTSSLENHANFAKIWGCAVEGIFFSIPKELFPNTP